MIIKSFFLGFLFVSAAFGTEEDLTFQKKVMDGYSEAGIILVTAPNQSREQWGAIEKAKDVIIPVIKGKVDLLFVKKDDSAGKRGNTLTLSPQFFDSPDAEVLKKKIDADVVGSVIRENFQYNTSLKWNSEHKQDPVLIHPTNGKKLFLGKGHVQEEKGPDPLHPNQMRIRIEFQGIMKGIEMRGYEWGKLHAYTCADYQGFRFTVLDLDYDGAGFHRLEIKIEEKL